MSFTDLAEALKQQGHGEIQAEEDARKIRQALERNPRERVLSYRRIAEILGVDLDKKPDASKQEREASERRRRHFPKRMKALVDIGFLKKRDEHSYTLKQDEQATTADVQDAFAKSVGHKATLEPGHVIGVVQILKGKFWLEPLDGEQPLIPLDMDKALEEGDIITVAVDEKNKPQELIKRHGHMDDHNALGQISAMAHNIPREFPDDILEGVDLSVPKAGGTIKDFTKLPFISIDPVGARDKDDVVCARRKTGGGWTLYVGVAAVSHYVRPGTKVFNEAVRRGNSTYFADGVIPMLPEPLSNGVCSLHPKVNRLATVSAMEIDRQGNITDYRFETGIIRSRAEFTYEEAQAAIDGDKSHIHAKDKRSWGWIEPLLEVSNARLKDKVRRGALNIDTPEQRVSIGRSRDISIALEVGNAAHNIIEEAMIAANICAADALDRTILRVHGAPRPEVLEEFADTLKDLGIAVPKNGDMKSKMQHIAHQIPSCHDPDEGYTVLTRMQTMAHYSADDGEHWALALKRYTHKTSPIRRIVDLIVDYGLNGLPGMTGPKVDKWVRDHMGKIADHASMTERRSQRAEEDCRNRVMAMWLRHHLDTTFEARVSRVNGKRLWIMVEQDGLEIKAALDKKDLLENMTSYNVGERLLIQPYEANAVTGIMKFKQTTPESLRPQPQVRPLARESSRVASRPHP